MRLALGSCSVALVLAAAASAAPGDPQKRLTAADQAYARSLVLRAADLGPGWRGSRSSSSGADLRCKGFEPDQSDLVETGDADGLEFERPDGAFVSSSASVFRSAADAQASWNRIVKPGLLTCLARIVERAGTSQVAVKVLSTGPLPFPKLAARQAAYRIVVAFTVARGASKLTLQGRFDLVLLGRARADVALFMLSLKPFSAQFEQTLARTISSRLKP